MRKPFPLLIGLLAVSLVACSGLALERAPVEGARAPDFTLANLEGQQVRLDDLRGEVVLLNFWATWCGPCLLEMPVIEARYQLGGFQVLAVDYDEPADLVSAYFAELGLSFPALLDPGGEVQRLYQVRGYPTSFFIDEQGIIQAVHIGPLSAAQLDSNLAQLGVAP